MFVFKKQECETKVFKPHTMTGDEYHSRMWRCFIEKKDWVLANGP